MMGFGLLGGGLAAATGTGTMLIYGAAKGASGSFLAEAGGISAGVATALAVVGVIVIASNKDEGPAETDGALAGQADAIRSLRVQSSELHGEVSRQRRIQDYIVRYLKRKSAPTSQPVAAP